MSNETFAWSGGKCRVPMWMGGVPSGFCGEPANGPQLPFEVLYEDRGWQRGDAPYCFGPCCPQHGGPKDGDPIVFQDGLTEHGRPKYCAVMPAFVDLQASHAGFDGDGRVAIRNLRAAIAKAEGGSP